MAIGEIWVLILTAAITASVVAVAIALIWTILRRK